MVTASRLRAARLCQPARYYLRRNHWPRCSRRTRVDLEFGRPGRGRRSTLARPGAGRAPPAAGRHDYLFGPAHCFTTHARTGGAGCCPHSEKQTKQSLVGFLVCWVRVGRASTQWAAQGRQGTRAGAGQGTRGKQLMMTPPPPCHGVPACLASCTAPCPGAPSSPSPACLSVRK